MKQLTAVIIVILVITSGSCEKINYSPDNPFSGLETRVLMHRGCGFNDSFIPNTLPAAEYGLSVLDGVEMDIQISADGTLWLDHDNEVHDCDGNVVGCFQTLTDSEIMSYTECNGIIKYYTVESVFELMASKYPESYISLDVKGQYCEIKNTKELMNQMATAVLALVDKYDMQNKVLVESSSLEFLSELDNQSSVGQCVISLGDVDEGIANAGVTRAKGISLEYGVEKIDAEVVSLIHSKGYGLILWVVNEPEDIKAAWDSKPDLIETDIADFKDYITKK